MITRNADDTVSELVTDIGDKQKLFDAITYLQDIYPDLAISRDVTKVSSLVNAIFESTAVNIVATNVEFYESDGMVYAQIYDTQYGYKVYASPYRILIGIQNKAGLGIVPNGDWQRVLFECNILKHQVSDAIHVYLANHPPISYL